MRIYLSGRISGNADAGVQFGRAHEEVRKRYPGADVFNPMGMLQMIGDDLHFDYDEFMHMDMAFLQLCDAIAMIPGWEESRGANREYGYAVGTGMRVILLEGGEQSE